jgi:hypothetical protein
VIEGYARAVAGGQQKAQSGGRVVGIVALCAAAAVAAIIGGTLLLSRHESTTQPGAITAPRPGRPVLQLEVGPKTALGRAAHLLNNGAAPTAAVIFRATPGPEAELGLAFAQWKGVASLDNVKAIAAANADDPAVQLNLGWADFQAGHNAEAVTAWEQTASRFPDSPYAVDALDALHPTVVPGLPAIVINFAAVPAQARRYVQAGWQAWNLKEVVTARRQFNAAAALAPHSPEVLVAAAVARFSPDQPKASFPILGPLTATFPSNPIVRLHLGELLLWNREVAPARKQLRLAADEQPGSGYAKQAKGILEALGVK